MLACGHELAVPGAEADLGRPADGLERCRERCQAPLEVPTAWGWLPVGPGSFDQGTPGVGMPGLGQAPLLPPRPTGLCRGCEPQRRHERSGGLDAGPVAPLRPGRHGHRALDPAPGLERCAHWRSAPGCALLVEGECQRAQPCRLGGDGLDVVLQDERRRRGGTHHHAEPAPGGRTPVGPPRRAAGVPQHKRWQPQLGRLQSPEGLVPRPTQSAEGFIGDGGHIHRGEVPGAHQPGQWPSVPPVGGDPVARLVGPPGGGDAPADIALCQQLAIEPGATGARFRDDDERRTLGLQRPSQLLNSALPGSDRAAGDDLRAMVLGDVGDRESLLVDISSDRKRARLWHG
jgi:hypothetical protein